MKKSGIGRAIFIVFIFLFSGSMTGAEGLQVGAGRTEIQIPPGIPLSGYGSRINRPHTGVHDPVFARALVLQAGEKRAGLINADILLVTRELRLDLEARTADLHLDLLAVTATHTHYSIGAYVDNPVAEIAVMGKYNPKAYEAVLTAMESALRQAAAELAPGRFGAAVVSAPGVTANRRHEGGPADPSFRVAAFWGEDGSLRAVLMNHAIHPTAMPSSTTLVSGDVTGAAEQQLEERYPQAVAMFLNAGLGDQSPGPHDTASTWEEVDVIGEKLAGAAEAALAASSPAADVTLSLYQHEFEMPPPRMRRSLECWGGLNLLFPLAGKSMIRHQGKLMGLGINQALLLFSPAELSYEVQAEMERAFPGRLVMVVVHANDYYGYVVTPEDYDTGGYETCMNFYGREFAPLLLREFQTMMRENAAGVR